MDANGNTTKQIIYHLDYNTSKCVGTWNYEVTYDTNSQPMQRISYNWDQATEDWVLGNKTIYYYSDINASLPNNSQTPIINLYPNPVTDYLTINCGSYPQVTFELFDLQGRKLMSKVVNNSETINMTELNNGTYVYQLLMDNKKQSGKIVKQ